MRIGFGAMALQHMLAIVMRQMQGKVCDDWKPFVIHTDEACQRMRPHQRERMGLIFGFELQGQLHANNREAVRLETTFDGGAWALAFDVTEGHTGFVHVVG